MLKFEIPKGTKQNLFTLFLNAVNREYQVKDNNKTLIFTVSKPYFSQDEVMLNMFFDELVNGGE